MSFYPLENTSRISEGYSRQFIVDGEDMLLVHSGGITRLISTSCPHDSYSLKKAKLAKGCIQCPKHRICFSLENGEALGGEVVAGVPPLKQYEVVQQGDEIGIHI